jgi:hypothetical protein
MTLAQRHLRTLGVPSDLAQPYERRDAVAVLQGVSVSPAVRDVIHQKLAWVVGVQIVGHLSRTTPNLGWTNDRVLVRTLSDGEASASFLSFEDGSHAVLLSRALQENLICMANLVVYFDVASGLARLTFTKKRREHEARIVAGRLTAVLRYLLLGQRMTGYSPVAPARLDRRSSEFASKIATGAVMFVVAHEIAHIIHDHRTVPLHPAQPNGALTVSESQELQADWWAFGLLTCLMSDDPAPEVVVLWCAFVALFAMQITERALYVRRNRTHPEALARWAELEKRATACDERTRRLRIGFMSAVMGASKLDEELPPDLWPLIWKDSTLSVDAAISERTLRKWDGLQSIPVTTLVAEARRSATGDGQCLLDRLARGDICEAVGQLVSNARRRKVLLDPAAALAFSTLRSLFAERAEAWTCGDSLVFSIGGARLAAQHLGNDGSDG